MPREMRRLIFSQSELYQAMREYRMRNSKSHIPMGVVEKLTFDPSKDPALVIRHRVPGELTGDPLTFRHAEVAAALILFCRAHEIPLPRTGRKLLEKVDGTAAFTMQLEWEIGQFKNQD